MVSVFKLPVAEETPTVDRRGLLIRFWVQGRTLNIDPGVHTEIIQPAPEFIDKECSTSRETEGTNHLLTNNKDHQNLEN